MAETPTTTTTSSWMDRVREFLKDHRMEFAKVSWPTRDELKDSTIVVIIAVILISIFVGLVDRVLTFVMGLIIR